MKVRLSTRLLVNDRAEMTSIAVSCHHGETKWRENERQTFCCTEAPKKRGGEKAYPQGYEDRNHISHFLQPCEIKRSTSAL